MSVDLGGTMNADPEWPTIQMVADKVNGDGPLHHYCDWIMETRGLVEGDRIWRAGCQLAKETAPPKPSVQPRRRWWHKHGAEAVR